MATDPLEIGGLRLVLTLRFSQPIPVEYHKQLVLCNIAPTQFGKTTTEALYFVLESAGVSAFHYLENTQRQLSHKDIETYGRLLLRWVVRQPTYRLLVGSGEVTSELLLDLLNVPVFLNKEVLSILEEKQASLNP